MLQIGWSRRDPGERARRPLPLLVPVSWLAIAAVFLLGFRIGLNVTDSNVIDVGYAGVIGADRLTHGEALYGDFPSDNEHGDTYGPVNYLAYVPFEAVLPWSGSWDDLPAAHGAALVFDLAVVLLLYALGRRIRGPRTGVVARLRVAGVPVLALRREHERQRRAARRARARRRCSRGGTRSGEGSSSRSRG